MAYSQDAELGHAFAAVYEWVIEGRKIPVVPIFVNTYLPPLPTARRCEQLGAKIRECREDSLRVAHRRQRRHVALSGRLEVSAAGFRFRLVGHRAHGARQPRGAARPRNEQLDEVGNTEMLPWMILFGAIGQPGELITYQPTWHHGHAVMRFIPNHKNAPTTPEPAATGISKSKAGYQFYKHPDPNDYPLNKVLFDLRFSGDLRRKLFAERRRWRASTA